MSEQGREQARQTGLALADRAISAVYTSPLLRARQTAEAIAGPHGLTIELVQDLVEVDVGRWEGRTWEEVERTDPEAFRLFRIDAGIHPYLGGETLGAVQARVAAALERLMSDNLGRLIVAVGHNCVNRAYLARLLDMPLAKYRAVPQDNCGVNLLRYRHGRTQLVTVNALAHLEC